MKRVFIVHGWGGNSGEDWLVWLKNELMKRKYHASVLAMPDTNTPKIKAWVSHLEKAVGRCDEDTFFVGHSVGCQTILRYIGSLPEGVKVGGIVLVAPWLHLKPVVFEDEGAEEIAEPWIKTPINWEKITSKTKNIVCIFSDNDPYVPLDDSKIFREKLKADVMIEHGKGHLSSPEDGIKEIPLVLEKLLSF